MESRSSYSKHCLHTVTAAAFALVARTLTAHAGLSAGGRCTGAGHGPGLIHQCRGHTGYFRNWPSFCRFILLVLKLTLPMASGKGPSGFGPVSPHHSSPGPWLFRLLGYAFGGGSLTRRTWLWRCRLQQLRLWLNRFCGQGRVAHFARSLDPIFWYQDMWAIFFWPCSPLARPALTSIAIFCHVSVFVPFSSFLPVLFRLSVCVIAHLPELMPITVVVWCFMVSGLAEMVGSSQK